MTLFDWLKNISYEKKHWDSFSEIEQKEFNSYMINKFVSMYEPYIEIANLAQRIPLNEKKLIHEFYRTILPKKTVFFKFIKKSKKSINDKLLNILSQYYKIPSYQANDYASILTKNDLNIILEKMGYDEKEIKNLFK